MIESDTLIIEPLGRRHDRVDFSYGLPALDRYLLRQASQDIRRHGAPARVIRVLADLCCGHPMAVRVRGPLEQCGQLSTLCWLT